MMSYTRWTRVGIMVVPMSEIAVNIWFMIWLYDIHTGRRATRLLRAPFISPTTFEQARGGALGAGGGRVGFAGGGLF